MKTRPHRSPKPRLKVCAVYEDIHTWRDVWRLMEDQREATGYEFEICWFSFAELPLFLNRASRIAVEADLAIIAAKGKDRPEAVRSWLNGFGNRRSPSVGAIIGLVSEIDQNASQPWERLLEDAARASGRDLFVRIIDRPRPARAHNGFVD